MHAARTSEWIRHLFRYQSQLRAEKRSIGASDIETLKTCAALVLAEQRPSQTRIAHENTMALSEHAVAYCLQKLSNLGVVHPRGAGWTTGAPATWQGYNPHAADPPGVERQVASFTKDLEARVVDTMRRNPPKRATG
jgi:hypothetical protein